MTWIATPTSSNVSGFEYSPDSQVLTVEFKNGTRYNYYDVPAAVAEQMQQASSVGKFLAQYIKNVYRYARA